MLELQKILICKTFNGTNHFILYIKLYGTKIIATQATLSFMSGELAKFYFILMKKWENIIMKPKSTFLMVN